MPERQSRTPNDGGTITGKIFSSTHRVNWIVPSVENDPRKTEFVNEILKKLKEKRKCQ